MGSDGQDFDVIYRGHVRAHIRPGKYVFIQRAIEHGGGYWFGQAYDDFFKFALEWPVSLREGIKYLMAISDVEKHVNVFDDSLDDFVLRGE